VKSFQVQTFYELLEVSVGATDGDIRSAFERLSRLYAEDQVALYGLIDEARARALRGRLQEAADVLLDEDRRATYDASIGLPPRDAPVKKKAPAPGAAKVPSSGWVGAYTFVSSTPTVMSASSASFTYTVAASAPVQPARPVSPVKPPAGVAMAPAPDARSEVAAGTLPPEEMERRGEMPSTQLVSTPVDTRAERSAPAEAPAALPGVPDDEAPVVAAPVVAAPAVAPVVAPAEAPAPPREASAEPAVANAAAPALRSSGDVSADAAPAPEPISAAHTVIPGPAKQELESVPVPAPAGVGASSSSAEVQSELPDPAPSETRPHSSSAVPAEGEGGAMRSVAPVAETDTTPDASSARPEDSARSTVDAGVPERPIVSPPRVDTVEAPAMVSADASPPEQESAIVPTRPFTPREYRAPERPRPFEVPPGVEFNGDLLRQVRMARGLSLLQLSERTRIGVRHLENLEGDRYDALPALVYLRGMLMNMARELGLDGLRVSKSYLTFVEAHQAKAKG
jgi:hypothetical protein